MRHKEFKRGGEVIQTCHSLIIKWRWKVIILQLRMNKAIFLIMLDKFISVVNELLF